jgi:phage N-6-adenine-methyltransferase
MVSSKSDEYYTPSEYIDAAYRVMGVIDLDPATSEDAQEIVGATWYYSKEEDGLSKDWYGRVWLNPPFSKTSVWVNKLEDQYKKGNVSEAILLCKAALGYKWFEGLWRRYPVVCARERIQFIGGPGKAKQATAFVYMGPHVNRFIAIFGVYGRVILPGDEEVNDNDVMC